MLNEIWRQFRKQRLALLGGGILVVLLLTALLAPVLAPAIRWRKISTSDCNHRRRAIGSVQTILVATFSVASFTVREFHCGLG